MEMEDREEETLGEGVSTGPCGDAYQGPSLTLPTSNTSAPAHSNGIALPNEHTRTNIRVSTHTRHHPPEAGTATVSGGVGVAALATPSAGAGDSPGGAEKESAVEREEGDPEPQRERNGNRNEEGEKQKSWEIRVTLEEKYTRTESAPPQQESLHAFFFFFTTKWLS